MAIARFHSIPEDHISTGPQITLPSFIDITQHRQFPLLLQNLDGPDFSLLLADTPEDLILWGGRMPYFFRELRRFPEDDTPSTVVQDGADDAKFVIMGDQNLDPVAGDGESDVMQKLHDDPLVNQNVMNGELYPVSHGASEHAIDKVLSHPKPSRISSTFGLAVDYAIPSASLNVIDTGVYWSASNEEGRKLFNDTRIGQYGDGKSVSSDHRMIWIKAKLQ